MSRVRGSPALSPALLLNLGGKLSAEPTFRAVGLCLPEFIEQGGFDELVYSKNTAMTWCYIDNTGILLYKGKPIRYGPTFGPGQTITFLLLNADAKLAADEEGRYPVSEQRLFTDEGVELDPRSSKTLPELGVVPGSRVFLVETL